MSYTKPTLINSSERITSLQILKKQGVLQDLEAVDKDLLPLFFDIPYRCSASIVSPMFLDSKVRTTRSPLRSAHPGGCATQAPNSDIAWSAC